MMLEDRWKIDHWLKLLNILNWFSLLSDLYTPNRYPQNHLIYKIQVTFTECQKREVDYSYCRNSLWMCKEESKYTVLKRCVFKSQKNLFCVRCKAKGRMYKTLKLDVQEGSLWNSKIIKSSFKIDFKFISDILKTWENSSKLKKNTQN